jgi:CheY-like chemotaxis protein
LQALGLSLLLVLCAGLIFWYGAFFVPDQRQAAVDQWGRDLSVIADTRRDLLDRRISEGTEGASFVATFPSVRALASSVRSGGSGEESVPHVAELLSNFRNVYRERSISIHDAGGAVLASSDGPAPGADAIALAREAAHSGKPRIDLVREPDGLIAFVVAAPVRESHQNAETGGAVLVVGDAKEKIFDLLRQPFTAATGEAVLVRRDGDSALYLSPLRFRPDPPLTFRRALNVPGFTARGALEGDLFGSFVDYRGAKVFAAGRKLKRAPWALVVKVDEEEALAAFRKDMLQKGVPWGALLIALSAAALGLWRSLVISNEVKLARSEARFGERVGQVRREPAVRSLVQAVLERHGYVVLVAEHGAAALDVVDKHPGPIHVLLTDIVMPGMNGRDLAGVVTARRPSIRVIFMSGYTADIPTDLGVEGGPLFLSKPFSEQALTSKLREALEPTPT